MERRLSTVILAAIIFLGAVLFPAVLHAEEITDNDFNFALDIPEGYKVAGYTPDGMSYQFKHTKLPVDFVLRLYPEETYKNASAALQGTLERLSAQYDGIDTFTWRNKICAITIFDSKVTSPKGSVGWSVAVPLEDKEFQLVLLCYADSDKAKDCEQFIISTLNSLTVDEESKKSPGIITTYAFPGTSLRHINLDIGGKRIVTSVDKEDSEANQFVIDCEFAVLRLYVNDEKWKEAWTRYYRAVFRDSYRRLQKTAFDINTALMQTAKAKNPKNPKAAMNEILLRWVQNFEYQRSTGGQKTDFTNVIDVLYGKGNDCDSRSMLMCVLMEQLGVKSELFISREYSHAVYGIDIDAPGAKINVNGTDFLLNETTAKNIRPGLIAQDQSDTEKWIPVLIP